MVDPKKFYDSSDINVILVSFLGSNTWRQTPQVRDLATFAAESERAEQQQISQFEFALRSLEQEQSRELSRLGTKRIRQELKRIFVVEFIEFIGQVFQR
jgi:hypothetical protein